MSNLDGQIQSPIDYTLESIFGFKEFRPHQREVCLEAWRGEDVLLVMPTGAGKSLCYQLPTVAREHSRTIVISPLLALIEDQVQKLQSLGIAAERIHSGRNREESQEVCRQWKEGALQFLFIAPERLSIQNFMAFLSSHKPSMIAIDEAHCISMWGHDFRADYRHLGERLKALRPANIIALTATATPEVQKDVVSQLNLQSPKIFVHGFKRTNIAVNILELPILKRIEIASEVLQDKSKRPAIVYAPTRRVAEQAFTYLNQKSPTGLYHAGLDKAQRSMTQTKFLSGELDIIVATVAFGMGVDKSNIRTVIHLAASGSMESYYQEIGRAGRDGLTSEAYLLCSYYDKKIQDYFLEMNYPDIHKLEAIISAIKTEGVGFDELLSESKISDQELKSYLEKLWVHGGVFVDQMGRIQLGKSTSWKQSYSYQRHCRELQINQMFRFIQSHSCRMVDLIQYFGDHSNPSWTCGHCDRCKKSLTNTQFFRKSNELLEESQIELLKQLVPHISKSAGQLFREHFEHNAGWDRRVFQEITEIAQSKGFLFKSQRSIKKDGDLKTFDCIGLTDQGRIFLHKKNQAPSLASQQKALESRLTSAKRKNNNRNRFGKGRSKPSSETGEFR